MELSAQSKYEAKRIMLRVSDVVVVIEQQSNKEKKGKKMTLGHTPFPGNKNNVPAPIKGLSTNRAIAVFHTPCPGRHRVPFLDLYS